LPYKEPSATLYQLLQNIVEEGRRFASISDMKISDMNNQAPVGTTLALMERNQKVMSAVQARLHAAMKKEFDILVGIVRDFTEPAYPYETDEEEFIKAEDFDKRIDVLPVSDPNAATMAQRIMQYQAAMQLSQTAPNMYDLPELHRQMLGVLGINDVDNIVPDKDDIKAVDPVTAVQNLINGKPVKAFINQDHDAHIEVIASVQQNQEIMETVEKSPNAAGILAAASAYVNDHLTMKYREDIEKELGVELPPMGEPLPADIEKRISSLVAEAAQRVLGTSQQRAEKLRVQEMQKDPLIQAKEKEVAIKEQEALRRAEEGEKRLQLDAAKAANRDAIERERIKSQTQIAGAQIGSKAASELLKADQLADKKATDDFLKGVDLAKDLLEDS
jgi:cell division septum initiation protein DivIVA